MAKQKYVPIFLDWTETTQDLTQEEKGNLIDAIVDYAAVNRSCEEILNGMSGVERVAFRFLKGQVDRNIEISLKRSDAGSSKREQPVANENKTEQKPTKTNKSEQKRFVKPTVDEVAAYCRERNNNVQAQKFIDFYESKGWKVGNQPMKDWKACVRTWENRENNVQGGKVVAAQKYTQRDYGDEDEEARKRMMEGVRA